MKIKNYKPYLICITLCILVEAISSLITKHSISDWYPTIIKPSFTPPNWIFGPVWTILYIMMGFSWGHINTGKSSKILGMQNIAFSLQLLLNFLWSYIYFGTHNIGYAWIELNLLTLALMATIYYFFKISKFSGWLLIPYLIWTLYANLLNGAIWYLNS